LGWLWVIEFPITPRSAIVAVLGGTDRRTLFLVTSESHVASEALAKRSGRIETVEVEVLGAALP
jgi:hypothetical protein